MNLTGVSAWAQVRRPYGGNGSLSASLEDQPLGIQPWEPASVPWGPWTVGQGALGQTSGWEQEGQWSGLCPRRCLSCTVSFLLLGSTRSA